MSNVLVISGHPELEKSHTNSIILSQLQSELANVSVRKLDRLYPDYQIHVAAEQQALLEADVVVLQFPFYWYSVPALLKKWIDDVFAYNFAYGSKGDKLKGKHFLLSFTIGGPAESYDPQGYNHFTIEELIKPLQQTAYLAGMQFEKPVYSHGMVYIPSVYNTQEKVEANAYQHSELLIEKLNQLTQSAETRLRTFVAGWFEQFDQLPQGSEFFTNHLAGDVNWSMPEGSFIGHEGFRDWYAIARQTFKPGCDHQVEQIEVKTTEQGFELELRIRLFADTFADSALQGETINMLVNEVWHVTMDDSNHITIHDYQVFPVNG